ncbi:Zinc/iron permease [Mytilinidion resinicola]|uniref:Zinc/iron permease n=1 Tax=Mytilinidion resinicola TaxID=574789 RepID=A0A6A6YBZ4_9PEZI|nr:Zinc/iron permease [Mytilinidion resinicola]KAF2806098.1 Zinc/iron permease [Mytilinidion resinicola]
MSHYDGTNPATSLTWSEVPTHILRAELQRRQDAENPPPCGTKGGKGHYNTAAHVAALIIILTLSTAACSFPIIVRRFPRLRVPHQILFLSRHFGTGVLIATAFVHLLPTAFQSLTDPCLPYFWNQGYPAMPGLIAMTSVLIVVGIEMFFASRGAGHIHTTDYDAFPGDDTEHRAFRDSHTRPLHKRSNSFGRFRSGSYGHPPDLVLSDIAESSEGLMAGRSPSVPTTSPLPPTTDKRDSADDEDDSDLELDELHPIPGDDDESGLLNGNSKPRGFANRHNHNHNHNHAPGATNPEDLTEAQQRKLFLQCMLLEAGILFHSVFIGMALSVAVGTSFIVLLVAISFHQIFEGLALGARIAALRFDPSSPKPWLMALAYGTTTPIGQAIGLGIHNLYDPASQTGLLMVGVMNAISSGLLLFAGLVELLAEDFLSDESYVTLYGRRRLEACAAVVGGALLMALVGAWA